MTGPVVLADLSAADLVLFLVTLGCIAAVTAVMLVLWRLLTVIRELRHQIDRLDAQLVPLVDDLSRSLADANEELDRIDQLVGSAEAISATVDATSRLAYRALSAPVIKTVAVTSGASRAARRFKRGT